MTVTHHSKDDDVRHHHQQHHQDGTHEEVPDLEFGQAQDHVPLASAILIDEGLIEAEVFQDEELPPTSSPPQRSYSSSSSSSTLPGSASVIYDAVTTCPIIDEGSSAQRSSPSPLLHHLGRRAQTIDCPLCREEMMTTVATSRIGGFAIIMSLLVLLMASPFFWIPLVIPMCRVTKHYCSKCHQQVGETHPCG